MPPRTQQALFPILRRLSDGAFHSGQALAHEFGLSRASVFNVLTEAERLGLTVHAVRGRGYRLPDTIEWLSRAAVMDALGAQAGGFDLHLADCVDSTNSVLLALAQRGAREGTTVVAEHQLAGRGRRGRAWHAAPGGSLTFSVLWRFEGGLQSLGGLSLVVGLAVARAINRHGRSAARVKWPNDILVGRHKLAGILIEVQGDMNGPAIAVAGVGINVRLHATQRERIGQAATDLETLGVTPGRNRMLAECLAEIRSAVETFRLHGFAALRETWQALDACAGKTVTLHLPDGRTLSGTAAGVDDGGAFLLRGADGTLGVHHGGEISLRLGRTT